MNAWRTRMEDALRAGWNARHRIGIYGGAGIALAMLGLVILLAVTLPQYREAGRLRAQLETARAERAAVPASVESGPASSAQRVLSLAEVPALILKLQQIATANGLVLETGEYRLTREAGADAAYYHIALPLHGSYAQARAFIGQALDDMPALTLDDMSLKRDAVGTDGLDTAVRFSLPVAVGA